MSDLPSDPAEAEAEAQQGSVFGNLPDSRPGERSPLRDPAAETPVGGEGVSEAARRGEAEGRREAGHKPQPTGERKPASPAGAGGDRGRGPRRARGHRLGRCRGRGRGRDRRRPPAQQTIEALRGTRSELDGVLPARVASWLGERNRMARTQGARMAAPWGASDAGPIAAAKRGGTRGGEHCGTGSSVSDAARRDFCASSGSVPTGRTSPASRR